MVQRSISLLPRQWAWLTRRGRGNAAAAVRAWVAAGMAAAGEGAGEAPGAPGAAAGAGRRPGRPASAPPPARARRPAARPERVSRRGLFLTREEMAAGAAAAATERDRLLVRALAETGARLGEALALTPARLGPDSVVLPIEARRRAEEKTVYLNPRSPLLRDLRRYAGEHGLARDARFWPFTRQRGHTLVTRAAAAAGVFRLKPATRGGARPALRAPAWPHLFRHGAAAAMLEDSDDDAVFVRDQLGHRSLHEPLHYLGPRSPHDLHEPLHHAARSEAERREKAARLRIAPETWR
jgi:integrase